MYFCQSTCPHSNVFFTVVLWFFTNVSTFQQNKCLECGITSLKYFCEQPSVCFLKAFCSFNLQTRTFYATNLMITLIFISDAWINWFISESILIWPSVAQRMNTLFLLHVYLQIWSAVDPHCWIRRTFIWHHRFNLLPVRHESLAALICHNVRG